MSSSSESSSNTRAPATAPSSASQTEGSPSSAANSGSMSSTALPRNSTEVAPRTTRAAAASPHEGRSQGIRGGGAADDPSSDRRAARTRSTDPAGGSRRSLEAAAHVSAPADDPCDGVAAKEEAQRVAELLAPVMVIDSRGSLGGADGLSHLPEAQAVLCPELNRKSLFLRKLLRGAQHVVEHPWPRWRR